MAPAIWLVDDESWANLFPAGWRARAQEAETASRDAHLDASGGAMAWVAAMLDACATRLCGLLCRARPQSQRTQMRAQSPPRPLSPSQSRRSLPLPRPQTRAQPQSQSQPPPQEAQWSWPWPLQ